MKQRLNVAGLTVVLSIFAGHAIAQEKLKIGVIVTLSGPAAVLGQQARDGFMLAVKDLGGKMAGRDVEVVAVDDELKPDAAVTKVKGLLEREKVDFVVFTGPNDRVIASEPTEKVKCVVWDLDNTIWHGTLIEDGIDALSLRSGIREVIEELDRAHRMR